MGNSSTFRMQAYRSARVPGSLRGWRAGRYLLPEPMGEPLMKLSGRWVLIGALSALYLAVLGGIAGWIGWVVVKAKHVAVAVHHEGAPAPLPKGHLFTRVETNTFLDAARRAEDIADPLQRCLAYPDPPGSHWDRDVVVAYCKYRNQPTISFAQIKQMVQAGHARELDKLFDAALHAQLTDPDARGRLDRIFVKDFGKTSFDIRSTLDAWKRQSPDSAFAWAASGYEYREMASDARGSDYISKTPQSALDAMDRLARQADADLKHALALNPKITPAYGAMVYLGGIDLGNGYAMQAVEKGLVEVPDNLNIYESWMWLEQPNWDGSLAAMDAVARGAQKQAGRNPLLRMLASSRDLYRIGQCECAADTRMSAYAAVLDKPAGATDLNYAGYAAKDANNPSVMTIYLSEALRFDPDLRDTRIDRIYDLVEFDRIQWAIDEASRMIADSPRDEYPIKARGWAYLVGNDMPDAQKDFETAAQLDPSDVWVLTHLCNIYVGSKQWDKAWDLANRMIREAPQDSTGWVARAQIQAREPRPGLKETTDYLESHFYTDGKNLQFNAYIAHLRTAIQQQAKTNATLATGGGSRRVGTR
jgi:hypothetical protein